MDFLSNIDPFGDPALLLFSVILTVTILVMLLVIQSIYNKLRILSSEIQSLRRDQAVMSEEMEVIAMKKGDESDPTESI